MPRRQPPRQALNHGEAEYTSQMPTEDTRRLLKLFGIAVTELEDAVARDAPPEDLRRTEAEAAACLREVADLIDRLRARIRS